VGRHIELDLEEDAPLGVDLDWQWVELLRILGLVVGGLLGDALDSPYEEHHVVVAHEFDEDVHDGLVVHHRCVVAHEHHACDVGDEVVGDAHGHPHGWSGKNILMNANVSDDVVAPSCRKMT
jgi:hypothetical protein